MHSASSSTSNVLREVGPERMVILDPYGVRIMFLSREKCIFSAFQL